MRGHVMRKQDRYYCSRRVATAVIAVALLLAATRVISITQGTSVKTQSSARNETPNPLIAIPTVQLGAIGSRAPLLDESRTSRFRDAALTLASYDKSLAQNAA